MITHCICYKLPFLLILEIAKSKNLKSIEEIKEKERICNKCCLCNKYIQESLETGKIEFIS